MWTNAHRRFGLIMQRRWGIISYADSLDCVGILAKSAEDIKPVFGGYVSCILHHRLTLSDVLSRYDPKDPTSALEPAREEAREMESMCLSHEGTDVFNGLTIGIPQVFVVSDVRVIH